MTDPEPYVDANCRTPSERDRCAYKGCTAPPVADMARAAHYSWGGGHKRRVRHYGYCAEHLAGYARLVRDGSVWVDFAAARDVGHGQPAALKDALTRLTETLGGRP